MKHCARHAVVWICYITRFLFAISQTYPHDLLFLYVSSFTPSPPPYFPSLPLSLSPVVLSLGWNHTCASHTSRHTGETYAGWNMVRELCWISLAKRVVINRMTFGNNYQPSSLHPSFPPSFSSCTHLSLCPSPPPSHSIVPSRWGQRERKRKEGGEISWG